MLLAHIGETDAPLSTARTGMYSATATTPDALNTRCPMIKLHMHHDLLGMTFGWRTSARVRALKRNSDSTSTHDVPETLMMP